MLQYYRINPQLNEKKAFENFEKTKLRMRNLPPPKETYEDFEDVWEATILKTAFSFLYTIRRNKVYIIDVRDQRGNRSAEALRKFDRELKKLHGIDQ
ncbi:MAG: hypothetical protein GY751_21445 [Bacteroidetes bacterium]|nr:hypothetical protein [Bacteroidota bacterium]